MGNLIYLIIINAMAMPVVVKETSTKNKNPIYKKIVIYMWIFCICQAIGYKYAPEILNFIETLKLIVN